MVEKIKKIEFQSLPLSIGHLKQSLPYFAKGYFMTAQDKWALTRVLKEFDQKEATQPTAEVKPSCDVVEALKDCQLKLEFAMDKLGEDNALYKWLKFAYENNNAALQQKPKADVELVELFKGSKNLITLTDWIKLEIISVKERIDQSDNDEDRAYFRGVKIGLETVVNKAGSK